MNYFILAIVAVAGVAVGMYMARRDKEAKTSEGEPNAQNEERAAAKQAAVERVFKEIQERGIVTNDEVQALLGVSDATAERYLQALETAGRIVQVGETGKAVSYKVA